MIGRYRLDREIGRGGMAVVYLARQVDLDRDVVVKQLAGHIADSPEFTARFLREARIAGALSHPNIVTVFEYLEDGRVPYIAMEYMPRGSLRPHVGRLTTPQIAGVLEAVLAALQHAAQRGVVHRDLKPENLMLSSDGSVQVADFGVAKAVDAAVAGTFATQEGTAIGTPAYMSPEQSMGRGVGPASDLYAVGVIAYEMLLGRVPFPQADSSLAVLMAHVNEPPPLPSSLDPAIDPALERWLLRMLAKDPADRPTSASEAWDALEEALLPRIGPMWRRAARILDSPEQRTAAPPLAPAPFASPPGGGPAAPGGPGPSPAPPTEPAHRATPATAAREPAPRRRGGPWPIVAAGATAVAVAAAGVALLSGGLSGGSALTVARGSAPPTGPLTATTSAVPVTAPVTTVAGPTTSSVPVTTDPVRPARIARRTRWAASTSSRVFATDPGGTLTVFGRDPLSPVAAIGADAPRRVGAAAGRVYLLERTRVRVLDAGDLSPLASIPFPGGVAVFAQPEGAVVAAEDGTRGRVCVIDVAALGPCARLSFMPTGLGAATPRVFVADGATGRVQVLRRTEGTLEAEDDLPVGDAPAGRIFGTDGRLVLPVGAGLAISGPGGLRRTVSLGEPAGDVALVPETGTFWVTLWEAGAVAVIDDATGRVRRIPVAVGPESIARWRAGPDAPLRLVVVHTDGTVTVLDAERRRVVRTLPGG